MPDLNFDPLFDTGLPNENKSHRVAPKVPLEHDSKPQERKEEKSHHTMSIAFGVLRLMMMIAGIIIAIGVVGGLLYYFWSLYMSV